MPRIFRIYYYHYFEIRYLQVWFPIYMSNIPFSLITFRLCIMFFAVIIRWKIWHFCVVKMMQNLTEACD